jgi:hypothetical protein
MMRSAEKEATLSSFAASESDDARTAADERRATGNYGEPKGAAMLSRKSGGRISWDIK